MPDDVFALGTSRWFDTITAFVGRRAVTTAGVRKRAKCLQDAMDFLGSIEGLETLAASVCRDACNLDATEKDAERTIYRIMDRAPDVVNGIEDKETG